MESDSQPAESHLSSRGARAFYATSVGCLVFVACVVAGVFITVVITKEALRDIPQEEAYEALALIEPTLGWWCAGFTLSISFSLLVAIISAVGTWWATGRRAR